MSHEAENLQSENNTRSRTLQRLVSMNISAKVDGRTEID